MKYIIRICTCILVLFIAIAPICTAFSSEASPIKLTKEEKEWILKNKDRKLILGIDPYSGIEHFEYKGEEKGYLIPIIEMMNKDLGLNIKLDASRNWGDVYAGLRDGSVDILLGANETIERKKFMAFTQSINKNSYAIIAKKDSGVHTIGDIDKKTVGFMKDDIIIDLLPNTYKNIKYIVKSYPSQEEGIKSLNNNEIDAFIMPGGPVVYDYIYRFPQLIYAFKLSSITSDMTMSTRKQDGILADILDKEIEYLKKDKLPKMISQSEIEYNIKIMNLTSSETEWLKNDGKAVVGITKDYLPFDYYKNGVYKGISGEIIKEISRKTGIKFVNRFGDFDELYESLKNGKVDILNIAKTDDRLKYIIYPRPYSNERDIIIGRKDSAYIRDIFGLEGKRVAIIKGFWHYEHLIKNLTDFEVIETRNIKESLELVHKGKADYLIENPTVARYYIEELQLYDLVEKGVTSNDSCLYYGVSKSRPELASIIDKVIPLIDVYELSRVGYEQVPHINNKRYYKRLIFTIIGLGTMLIIIILYSIKLVNDLVKERTQSELLREREQLLYIDSLTGVHNRNYFNLKIDDILKTIKYPHTVIVADMNNLKKINDKYGHHVGDELLKFFAYILKETCPKGSLVFRMGGDEFCIILENINNKHAQIIINSIKAVCMKKTITTDCNKLINASAAFGHCTRYLKDQNFDELLRIADQRMYYDKNKYKTC